MSTTKILIADDHRIFAQSLATLLSGMADFVVVNNVGNGNDALKALEVEAVDIVLSDLQMPNMGGIELTLKIRQRFPHIKVLMLTMVDLAEFIREAIQAGVAGYILKSADKDELEKGLRLVSQGETYFSPSVLRELVRQPAPLQTDSVDELSALSEREIDVLKLIAQECSTNQIAERLFISVNTVETHRRHLFQKLGVKNALGLIKFALRNGLAG